MKKSMITLVAIWQQTSASCFSVDFFSSRGAHTPKQHDDHVFKTFNEGRNVSEVQRLLGSLPSQVMVQELISSF